MRSFCVLDLSTNERALELMKHGKKQASHRLCVYDRAEYLINIAFVLPPQHGKCRVNLFLVAPLIAPTGMPTGLLFLRFDIDRAVKQAADSNYKLAT